MMIVVFCVDDLLIISRNKNVVEQQTYVEELQMWGKSTNS